MLQNEELFNLFIDENSPEKTRPIILADITKDISEIEGLTAMQKAWLSNSGWKPDCGKLALLPDGNGDIAGVIFGYARSEKNPLQLGILPKKLPAGFYHLEGDLSQPDLELLGWLLGAYSYDAYKSSSKKSVTGLKVSGTCRPERARMIADSVFTGRNLINAPSNDLGPEELEIAAVRIAEAHKAKFHIIRGDDLIDQNFPLIHAVGRASVRAPRLIDIRWGSSGDPAITLVGKGICFDTGGLNIKPGVNMLLMKKDMGGAAAVLALANMVMAQKLRINLRVIIAAAENSIAGNAFRPGDVITSRSGKTVEIANTDAEGRLVLADALSLADEEAPLHMMTFATLTGAARVALGVDLPPFYCTNDKFAEHLQSVSMKVADPVWRMPFWEPYDSMLKSSIADVNHAPESMFAGSITAAMFLKRFVTRAENYTHFDIYGWVPTAKAGKPKGGEPQAARAVFEVLEEQFAG